jgi:uncharacterized membrane protein
MFLTVSYFKTKCLFNTTTRIVTHKHEIGWVHLKIFIVSVLIIIFVDLDKNSQHMSNHQSAYSA